jgi:hypothetical protein
MGYGTPQGYPGMGGMGSGMGYNPSHGGQHMETYGHGYHQQGHMNTNSTVNDLLSHFTHNTGQQWSGTAPQYQMLSQMASQKLGMHVPPALLQSLVSHRDAPLDGPDAPQPPRV